MSIVSSVKNIHSQTVFTPCAAPPRAAFSRSFYAHKLLCGSLRPSAFSGLKLTFIAEHAEYRRDPQRSGFLLTGNPFAILYPFPWASRFMEKVVKYV